MTTWRELLEGAGCDMQIVALVPPDVNLDREFYGGYGTAYGEPFRLYTKEHIWFPREYDGAEDVACIPRSPLSKEEPRHY